MDFGNPGGILGVYYESMKRNLKIKPIYECRCNGRLQTKRFTCLTHTGSVVELEHLKIKTRLTNEKFVCVKGECGSVVELDELVWISVIRAGS